MYLFTSPSRLTRAFVATAMPLALVLAAGCSQNPYFAAPGGAAWQSPQNASVNQNEARFAELSRRVQLLDDNNRQLHTQLAQSEQKSQVYRDESELLRNQLAELSQQMESTVIAAREAQNKVRGMQASTQIRGNASIQANTNLSQIASRLNLGGIPVEQDGEAIRIVVPSDQLFQAGTAQLQPNAPLTLDPIAAQLRSFFPRQRIGIEGYTDNAQLYGGTVATTHQLASAQASAILDVLTRRSGMSPQQLFTVAQGANNPRQPNTTAAGRAANRRIELVIYPDTY
jgi:chemotaxis protein MotB